MENSELVGASQAKPISVVIPSGFEITFNAQCSYCNHVFERSVDIQRIEFEVDKETGRNVVVLWFTDHIHCPECGAKLFGYRFVSIE